MDIAEAAIKHMTHIIQSSDSDAIGATFHFFQLNHNLLTVRILVFLNFFLGGCVPVLLPNRKRSPK